MARMLSKKEVKELQEKLMTDKKFAKKFMKEQNQMLQQVKKELFGK